MIRRILRPHSALQCRVGLHCELLNDAAAMLGHIVGMIDKPPI